MAKTNYNKMSTKTEVVVETPVEEVEAPIEQVEPEVTNIVECKKGIVIDCVKLNIRKAPKANAEIIGTLDAGSIVFILDEAGDFYKIDSGDNSYCMKKYISVK